MVLSARLRVNRPHVVNEVVDGEAVVVDRRTGGCYRLGGTGTYVWDAIDRGVPTDEIVAVLQAAYPGERGVAAAVESMARRLLRRGLVVVAESTPAPAEPPAPPAGAFAPPTVEPVADLEELVGLTTAPPPCRRG